MTELREKVARVRFGDVVENGWASEDNPTRRGFFVREFVRTGRLNPGRTWELTDGCGKFWEFKPSDIGERLTVTSAVLNLIGGDGWWPIETAPKDGYFLARNAKGDVRRCWRHNPSSRTDEILSAPRNGKFAGTHWMKVPPPPPASS